VKKNLFIGLLVLALALVFSFSFVACSDDTEEEVVVPPPSGPTVAEPSGVYGGGGNATSKSPEKIAQDNADALGPNANVSTTDPRGVVITGPINVPSGGISFPSTLKVVLSQDATAIIPLNSKLTIDGDLVLGGKTLTIYGPPVTDDKTQTKGELVLGSIATISSNGTLIIEKDALLTVNNDLPLKTFALGLRGSLNIESGGKVNVFPGDTSFSYNSIVSGSTTINVKKGGLLGLPNFASGTVSYPGISGLTSGGKVIVNAGGQLNLISGNISGASTAEVYSYIGSDKSDFNLTEGSIELVVSTPASFIDRTFKLKGKATVIGGEITTINATGIVVQANNPKSLGVVYIASPFEVGNYGTNDAVPSELRVGDGSTKSIKLGVISSVSSSAGSISDLGSASKKSLGDDGLLSGRGRWFRCQR